MTTRTWFTSDNHFFHKGILNFCRDTRMGETVEEMNRHMIQIWNDTVSIRDEVYILGDFSFGNANQTEDILRQLHGRLHLVKGNHDYWIDERTTKYFESIEQYKEIKIDKQKVILFHYPIYEWNKMHYGSYHLYGHVHGNSSLPGRAIDVGIDARPQKDMGLWSWEELSKLLAEREIRTHHGKLEIA